MDALAPLTMTPGSLTAAAARLADAHADFERLGQGLTREILALQQRWQGAGGTAFATLMQHWEDRRRHIAGALTELGAALAATERELVAVDDAQAGAFSPDALDGGTR